MSKTDEISGSFMYAQHNTVSGSSLFNAVMGPGAGGNETIGMREFSFGMAWSRKF